LAISTGVTGRPARSAGTAAQLRETPFMMMPSLCVLTCRPLSVKLEK
jgi:hypothetical protein